MELSKIPTLRSGLESFGAQNLILMGVFFTIALHLQLVVGPDALQTGIRMLPISVAMFITSSCGGLLSSRWPVRTIVRTGLTNGFINSAEESEVPGLDPPPLPN